MTRTAEAATTETLAAALAAIAGADHVQAGEAARTLYSQDVWREGAPVDLVASPADEAECAAMVRACADAGAPGDPRRRGRRGVARGRGGVFGGEPRG
ncbi:MAG: FAD-binding oxidoreductase [Oceanicaulis sp.]|nr:FAD-binding oxidoreductase [Oceanicaulis sp.]